MPLPKVPLDLLNILFLPLMVATIVQAYKQRTSLWDQNLTARDRFLLQRIVIFVLLPGVVFLHECGHAAAARYFGGSVKEFHYALFWGYVIPSGIFSNLQILIIYLSGNIVQVLIGLVALLLALVARSPAIVTLLVYLGLWSAAGTLILYALMSFSGLYGDWAAIYSAPLPWAVCLITIIHALSVALILYLVYGEHPRLWFARKTLPAFAAQETRLTRDLASNADPQDWLELGWCYFRASLYKLSSGCLSKAQSINTRLPGLLVLSAALSMQARKYKEAIEKFGRAVDQEAPDDETQLRCTLAMADCYVQLHMYDRAEATYLKALELDLSCGDTRYLLWSLLVKMGNTDQARSHLLADGISHWLDPNLEARFKDLTLMEPL